MYTTYILKSQKNGTYYTGSTSDVEKRLIRHNKGKNKSTKNGIPWEIVHIEEYKTKQDAYKREMQIKRYKKGEAFKKLINK